MSNTSCITTTTCTADLSDAQALARSRRGAGGVTGRAVSASSHALRPSLKRPRFQSRRSGRRGVFKVTGARVMALVVANRINLIDLSQFP